MHRSLGSTVRFALACGLLLALGGGAVAVRAQGNSSAPDPGRHLFPPEQVVQFGPRIGLTAAQRTRITSLVGAAQAELLDAQWRVQEEVTQLDELLRGTTIDERAALAQVDRVLELERVVKRRHFALLIGIKNALTPDQQRKLAAARENPGK